MRKLDSTYRIRYEIAHSLRAALQVYRRNLPLWIAIYVLMGALTFAGIFFLGTGWQLIYVFVAAVSTSFLAGTIMHGVVRERVRRTGWRHGLSDMACGRDFNPAPGARLPRRYLAGPLAMPSASRVYKAAYASAILDLHRGKEPEELDGDDLARANYYFENADRMMAEIKAERRQRDGQDVHP
ncbi:hypothetical protein [Jiangella endophytica]|uniref:hypothetical protein n=1 Tax=Jiangella endophytica TaxID=1623398 RepID=UPI0013002315|nr:hypothetical protein [Jiangella endophytica]